MYKLKYLDKTKNIEERKLLYKKDVLDKKMNPVKDFNPETFDPLADDTEEYKVAKRKRKDVPKVLPTFGLKPKEILEGQMIGMYESKQDIYLIMAHRLNQLQEEIDLLKTKIK